jgi:signal transduction histidine kinase
MSRRDRAILGGGALALVLVASVPLMLSLARPPLPLDAPLDPGLRVPFAAAFLAPNEPGLRPGDLVVEIGLPGGGSIAPADRASLRRSLAALPAGAICTLSVRSGERLRSATATITDEPSWRRIARNWPVSLLGVSYLLFAAILLAGGRHPVATPLFHVAFWPGLAALAALDSVVPEPSALLESLGPRARLAALAACMVPASLIHLATRFPVVAELSRSRVFEQLPYGFWLALAVLAQVRLDDPATARVIAGFALVASALAAALLAAATVFTRRGMTPIERARGRALLVGLAAGALGPALLVARPGLLRPLDAAPLLTAIAFPVALGWAIVRYQLLDPGPTLRVVLLAGIRLCAGVALALGAVAVGARFGLGGGVGAAGLSEGLSLALVTVLVYQGIRSLVDRSTHRGARDAWRFERILDEAIHRFARAPTPGAVLSIVADLARRRLGASAVEVLVEPDPPGSRLLERASRLVAARRAPGQRMVIAPARSEDPDPDRPEVVLVLEPESTASSLVALAARDDALPWRPEDLRVLDALTLTAVAALGRAASTVELERRVAEKTAWIERSLDDRMRVLETARAVCEAEDAKSVLDRVARFLGPWAEGVEQRDAPPPAGSELLVARVGEPGRGGCWITARGIDPMRRAELAPQLETVSTFAGLALARLELLSELKREVEKQAQEIADARTRRLHAEFVRGVAHELRKPTQEVHELATQLVAAVDPAAQPVVARIRVATAELGRRLGLLLFHSGLRLDRRRMDLTAVLRDAVIRAASLHPDRHYTVEFHPERIRLVGDPSRLLSVAENLLDNAVKATALGGRIGVRAGIDGGVGRPPVVWFEVEDDGGGIAAEQLDEIFQPGVSHSEGGFGLGLSLCSEIVRAHEGSIGAKSDGTTRFHVRLPQFPAEEDGEG